MLQNSAFKSRILPALLENLRNMNIRYDTG